MNDIVHLIDKVNQQSYHDSLKDQHTDAVTYIFQHWDELNLNSVQEAKNVLKALIIAKDFYEGGDE